METAYPLKDSAGFLYGLCKHPHRPVLVAEETK